MSTDSAKLKQLREEFNLTQKALAEKLEVSLKLIVAIEGGARNISMKLYKKIQEVFNTDVHTDTTSCTYPDYMLTIPFLPDAQAAAGSGEALPLVETKESFYCDKRWLQNVIGAKPESTIVIKAKGIFMIWF
jgi:DNA-binding XRE family transcriptional regulator